MPFLRLFARFMARTLTAAGLYLIARWMFGLGSPITDGQTVRHWLWLLAEHRPRATKLLNRTWLDLCAVVGLTQIRLSALKRRVQEGVYADDTC